MDILQTDCWSADDILAYYPNLGIPHFQRGLVWGNDSVALLLESLYLGTPCGSLILWQPREPSNEGIALPGANQIRHLILDGQQRIRSIQMALSGNGTDVADVEDGDSEREEDEAVDRVWCLNLARVPELFELDESLRESFKDQERYSLFRYIQHPSNPKARFRYNVIPLQLFFEDRDAEINTFVRAGNRNSDLIGRITDSGLKTKIKELRTNKLFSSHVLKEDGRKNTLADVVSLYNRINSGGKRVESEEVAFASLVALAPNTGDWLASAFTEIHPPTVKISANSVMRDEVLRRRKERNFGFKLIIRTFIQVCAYHFGYSLGSSMLSFDVVSSPRFRNDISKALDKIDYLRDKTREILSFTRRTLRDKLYCDDLQMLPDTLALLPVFQLLIRFPILMKEDNGRDVVGSLILRMLLQPQLTQRLVLGYVELVNKCQSAGECISRLDKKIGSEIELKKMLENSNALQDRYTLLLYWMLRKNGVKDFLYKANLRQENLDAIRLEYGPDYEREVMICEYVMPEKQHIVPYKSLAVLYGIKARGRISRHPANNIGNITYISRALNHFATGLGSKRARLEDEPNANLICHFLHDESKPDLIHDYLVASGEGSPDQSQKAAFEKFCKDRRDLIAEGFLSWIKESRECAIVNKRIEPERRINPRDEDHVRAVGFVDHVEDALIDCITTGTVRYDENKMVFNICDRNRRIMFKMRLYSELQSIAIETSKKHLYHKFLQWTENAGNSLLEYPEIAGDKIKGRWVLSTEVDLSFGTVEVLNSLVKYLRQHSYE